MTVRLEHANLIVRDIDAAIRFLCTALPEFAVRHDETDARGRRWVHVGTAETYVTLTAASAEPAQRWTPYAGLPGVNHLAYEVDDVDALRARMRAAGYQDSTVPNRHPARKRVYFHDSEGNDWEFVQYLTGDPALRNDYSRPDLG